MCNLPGDELDEEDIEYDDSEEISDVDDTDLLKRLEEKYGRIDSGDKSNEEENDDASWTSNWLLIIHVLCHLCSFRFRFLKKFTLDNLFIVTKKCD